MGLGRGMVFGAIWGLLAAALLLVVVSLAAPPPQGEVAEVVPAAPDPAAPEAAADLAPTLAAPQAAEDGPAMPEPMPAAPDLPPGLAAAPQAPGGVGEAPAEMAAPVDPADEDPAGPAVAATATAPAAPSDETSLGAPVTAPTPEPPAEVASETKPSADDAPASTTAETADTATPPADPSAPVASLIPTPYGSEFAREAPDVSPALPGIEAAPAATPAPRPSEAAPDTATTADLDAAPAPQPSASAAPAEPTAPANPPETSGAVASTPAAARPEASAPGLVQPLPQRGAEPALPVAANEASSSVAPAAEVAAGDPAPEPAPAPTPEPADEPIPPGPAPEPGFRQATGIRVNQLPKIGDAALPGPLPGAEPPAELAPEAEALPALVAHAAPFNAAPDAPLLAIVLIDDRSGPGIAADLLADLPFPVTVALDPAAPGAAEAARAYRAAGQEVAILATLPRGATPSDLEVSWQAFMQALPEAVAVIDAPAARLQNDRRLAEQLILLAGEAGHGLLTWDIGLNPAAQLAAEASVPQAQVFRRLDAEQETAPVIGRYLDRAAFEASRSGAVVVTASTRPETLAALLDWAVSQSRTVTLAPLSAVLMRDF